MKIAKILFILMLLLAPVFVSADCSKTGTTVIYINGVLTSEDQAKADKKVLEYDYKIKGKNSNVTFITGYNESHFGTEIIGAAVQMYFGGFLDYNLTNILRQVHESLATQKIILVGYSQGTFYTNAAYNYLIEHGVDENSINVYNIATPDHSVAGKGKYLTSVNDRVIKSVNQVITAKSPNMGSLPANIDLKIPANEQGDQYGGHHFVSDYLSVAPDRIIGDIDSEINGLTANNNKSECFVQPEKGVLYKVQAGAYSSAKILNENKRALATSPYDPSQMAAISNATFQSLYNFGKSVVSGVSQVLASGKGAGSVVDSLGGATTVAPVEVAQVLPVVQPVAKPVVAVAVESQQDQLDDIQEKIDELQQQINNLLPKPTATVLPTAPVVVASVTAPVVVKTQPATVVVAQTPAVVTATYTGGGGSVTPYQKILISEVRIFPIEKRFVELYNPNSTFVNLTDWYLQRKKLGDSGFGSFVSSTNFAGKVIPAGGYFLISREILGSDITLDIALKDDDTLALKNPNGDIVDKVGWGNSQDPEGISTPNPSDTLEQSVGRKVLANGTESDENNNFIDFELQNPTPKSVNSPYTAPINDPPVVLKNILINEIQVAGKTVKDEFVELYNPNNVDVNMAGFALKKKTSGGTESNLVSSESFTGTIPAYGYFLVTPQLVINGIQTYTGLATPDLTYSGASDSFLISINNTVLLYNNSGVLQDKVGFGTAKDFETTATTNPVANQSIERKFLGIDSNNNADDFIPAYEPTPKSASPKVFISDVTNYSNCMSTTSPGTTFYNLNIKWGSANSNVVSYDVQENLNNSKTWNNWETAVTKTQDTFLAPYSLLGNRVYQFRVRGKDNNGNYGSWQTITVDLIIPVVVNEISYAGSQWIELLNKTSQPVDLTGMQIVSGSTTINLQGIIPANGYFILQQVDGNSFVISLTSNLYLLDKIGRQLDEVDANFSASQFIQGTDFYSMERISPYSFGRDSLNWIISNSAGGTPNAQNSNFQLYTSNTGNSFVEDTTLTKDLSPYLFEGNTQIFPGITLTIEPGVVIKFQNTNALLTVDGTLKAVGTGSDQITFTSFKNSPTAGSWPGIVFEKDSTNSDLENIVLNYAGSRYGTYFASGIIVNQTSIILKNSSLLDNNNYGIALINSNSTVDNVQLLNDRTPESWDDNTAELFIEGGSPTIKNSTFSNQFYGILMQAYTDASNNLVRAYPTILQNNFVNNDEAIHMSVYVYPNLSLNTASNNYFSGTVVSGIQENITLTADTMPYVIRNGITIPQGVTLTVSPGTILRFKDNYSFLYFDGTLKAIGTQSQPIIFGSLYYDQPWVVPGSWQGLYFSPTSTNSDLENIDISYAGYYNHGSLGLDGAIKVDQSKILLLNSSVHNNANNGLLLINSPSVIDGVHFSYQLDQPFFLATAVTINGGSPEIKNSIFDNNSAIISQNPWTDSDGNIIQPTPKLHDAPGDLYPNQFNP